MCFEREVRIGPFGVSWATADGYTSVHLRGSVDLSNAEAIRLLLSAETGDPLPMVVDLSDVAHTDSAGVRLILELRQAAEILWVAGDMRGYP